MARITRLYPDYDTAMSAAKELKAQGFAGDQIGLLAKPPGNDAAQAMPSSAELVAAIKAVGVTDAQARVFADEVIEGKALLCVWPPYGRSAQAISIMDSFNPTNAGTDHGDGSRRDDSGWKLIDEPAPLSKLLHIPVLIKD